MARSLARVNGDRADNGSHPPGTSSAIALAAPAAFRAAIVIHCAARVHATAGPAEPGGRTNEGTRERTMSRFASTAQLLIAAAFTVASAAAQTASPPDFSSNFTSWAAGIGVDFTPVDGSPSPLRQDPAHPFVPNGTGRQPTYRIADLSNPHLKQWAKDIMKKDNDEVIAGKIAFTPRQSCMPAGVPGFILYGGGAVHFVQTPKKVTMVFDGDMQVRHVYMNVP